jgi:hypothetical protein
MCMYNKLHMLKCSGSNNFIVLAFVANENQLPFRLPTISIGLGTAVSDSARFY